MSQHAHGHSIVVLLRDVVHRLGARVFGLISLMVLVALADGASMALLFPLLATVGIGSDMDQGLVAAFSNWLFATVGLPRTTPAVVGLVLSVFLLQMILFLTQSWWIAVLRRGYQAAWQMRLFSSYMEANWLFFTRERSGELINAMTIEGERLGGAFFTLFQLVSAVFVTLIYFVLAFLVSWQVTVLLLVVGITLFLVVRRLMQRSYRIGVSLAPLNAELQSSAGELIQGAKLIKATSTEAEAIAGVRNIVEQLRTYHVIATFLPNLTRGIFEFAGIVVIVLIVVAGTARWRIDLGSMLVMLALFIRLFPRLTNLQNYWHLLNQYAPSLSSVQAILQRARGARELGTGGVTRAASLMSALDDSKCDIRMEGVSVEIDTQAILRELNLSVPAGKMIAIVGPSGAGKSTVADCLLRLIEPTKGRILLGDRDVRTIAMHRWRELVRYVPQDVVLFHASVRQNILWGRRDATDDMMVSAAKKAFAHEFIMRLPEGYASLVGDRGVRLSGGQRQRIGLARALLGSPQVLIFDEATSALDSEAERTVLEAIARLHGSLTIVMIAHRLSTVRGADRIYVIEGGRNVEDGAWHELLHRNGRFRELWDIQFESQWQKNEKSVLGTV